MYRAHSISQIISYVFGVLVMNQEYNYLCFGYGPETELVSINDAHCASLNISILSPRIIAIDYRFAILLLRDVMADL